MKVVYTITSNGKKYESKTAVESAATNHITFKDACIESADTILYVIDASSDFKQPAAIASNLGF